MNVFVKFLIFFFNKSLFDRYIVLEQRIKHGFKHSCGGGVPGLPQQVDVLLHVSPYTVGADRGFGFSLFPYRLKNDGCCQSHRKTSFWPNISMLKSECCARL